MTFSFATNFPALQQILSLAAEFARYGFAVCLAGVFVVLFINRHKFGMLRAAALLSAVLFFCWPAYFSTNPTAAFVSVSIAHSLQYIAFMTVFWFNTPATDTKPPLSKAAIFFFVAIVGGAILTIRGEFGPMIGGPLGMPTPSSFIYGFMFGLVVAHFIVDAHAWRLRDKPQRDFVRSRFSFVFDH